MLPNKKKITKILFLEKLFEAICFLFRITHFIVIIKIIIIIILLSLSLPFYNS